jgi:hypothetical protein
MTISTLSSREFLQNANQAKKAAKDGPVIITDRGRPTAVLLSYEEYQKLTGKPRTIVEMLAMPFGDEPIDVEFPRDRTISPPFEFD